MKELRNILILILVLVVCVIIYNYVNILFLNIKSDSCLKCICNQLKFSELNKLDNEVNEDGWKIIANLAIVKDSELEDSSYINTLYGSFSSYGFDTKTIYYEIKEPRPGWKAYCIILLKRKQPEEEDEYLKYFKR